MLVKAHFGAAALALLACALAGCVESQKPTPPPARPVVKLKVLRNGEFWIDGELVDLKQLDAALAQAKQDRADLWCYRESDGEPPESYIQLTRLVAKHKILPQFVSDPDFSTPPIKKPLKLVY